MTINLETINKQCPRCETWEPVAIINNQFCTWCSDGKEEQSE